MYKRDHISTTTAQEGPELTRVKGQTQDDPEKERGAERRRPVGSETRSSQVIHKNCKIIHENYKTIDHKQRSSRLHW